MCFENNENNVYDCYAIHNNYINYDIILGEYGMQYPNYIYGSQTKYGVNLDYCENVIGEYITWYSNQYSVLFDYFTNINNKYNKNNGSLDYNVLHKLGDLYWRHKTLLTSISYIYNNYTIKQNISKEDNKELHTMNKDKANELPIIISKLEDILYSLQSSTIIDDIYTNDYKQYILKNIYEISMYIKDGILISK